MCREDFEDMPHQCFHVRFEGCDTTTVGAIVFVQHIVHFVLDLELAVGSKKAVIVVVEGFDKVCFGKFLLQIKLIARVGRELDLVLLRSRVLAGRA